MSAKTRLGEALILRDKIAGLYANAYDLLLKGKRDELQVSHLYRALQLFKENRLAGAVEKSRSDIEARSIEDLRIGIRAMNCLRAENITTIGQLVSLTEFQLLKIPKLGRRGLNEIIAALAFEGLSLAT